jgi:hypothetical protein
MSLLMCADHGIPWCSIGCLPSFSSRQLCLHASQIAESATLMCSVYFLQSFCKFLTFDTHKLAHKWTARRLIDTQSSSFDMECDLWRYKPTRHLTLYKLKWHMLLGVWHWGDKLEDKSIWHSFFVSKNVSWHFGFEVERPLKFVKRTHCFCAYRLKGGD